jgi:hypothetical protein
MEKEISTRLVVLGQIDVETLWQVKLIPFYLSDQSQSAYREQDTPIFVGYCYISIPCKAYPIKRPLLQNITQHPSIISVPSKETTHFFTDQIQNDIGREMETRYKLESKVSHAERERNAHDDFLEHMHTSRTHLPKHRNQVLCLK